MQLKKRLTLLLGLLLLVYLLPAQAQQSPVQRYGQLAVKGSYIMGEKGDTVQLMGMSLFWSQWMGKFYNPDVVKWLVSDWNCTIVRAAMGAEMGGYLTNPDLEQEKVTAVVDAAIESGIYVIIDFHSHEAHKHPDAAKKFFTEMAKKYGKYPNVLYEIYNEPLQDSWSKVIKPYSEEIIKAIREHDPDNIIICGTRQWSQLVNEAAQDPIKADNIAYTLHFYAGTHKKALREEAEAAMKNGVALIVTEYGTCHASGNDHFDPEESNVWFDFMDKYKISSCNWSIADKVETASALMPGVSDRGDWMEEQLTPSGKLVRSRIIATNKAIAKQARQQRKAKK